MIKRFICWVWGHRIEEKVFFPYWEWRDGKIFKWVEQKITFSPWDGAFRFGQGAEELEGESLGDFAVDLYTQVLGNIYENPELVEEAQ